MGTCGGSMNGWKKILIVFIIAVGLFCSGFFAGSWRANQIGDINDQNRIAEIERLDSELRSGDIQFRTDLERAEGKLQKFLRAEADRNSRAREILGRAKGEAGKAGDSIQRAIEAVDRLSEAIEILFSNE